MGAFRTYIRGGRSYYQVETELRKVRFADDSSKEVKDELDKAWNPKTNKFHLEESRKIFKRMIRR